MTSSGRRAGGRLPHRWSLPAAAAIVPALWIVAQTSKPLTIDDPLFLYWARAIVPPAAGAAGIPVNWDRLDESLGQAVAHYPPGWALALGWMRRLLGEGEAMLRWLQWPFAAMFLLGVARLAGTLGASRWAVLALCGTSPLFLLPAASLMPDLACAGPAVFGAAVWVGARGSGGLAAGAVFMVLALQMKPTALVLVPLLLLAPAVHGTRFTVRLAIAVATVVAGGMYPPVATSAASPGGWFEHVLGAWAAAAPGRSGALTGYFLLVCAGCAIFPAAWLLAASAPRPGRAPVPFERAAFLGIAAVAVPGWLGMWGAVSSPGARFAAVPPGLGALWFYGALAGFVAWLVRGRETWADNARARWLFGWLAVSLAGALAGAPFPAARFFIFVLPALAILLVLDADRLARRARAAVLVAACLGNLAVSVSLAVNDAAFADAARDAAARAGGKSRGLGLPLVTTGQWGLRWYVEREGGRAWGAAADDLSRGAILLVPRITDHRELPARIRARMRRLAVWEFPGLPIGKILPFPRPLAPPERAASFHGGHYWLPYSFWNGWLERIDVYRVDPSPGAAGVRGRGAVPMPVRVPSVASPAGPPPRDPGGLPPAG